MIGSLRGRVLERPASGVVLLEVAGVGYLCSVTTSAFAELEPGVEVHLHVHHHIREDSQTLFAFRSREERDTFQVLLSSHGVGPSLALAVLSTYSPTALVSIVSSGDVGALTVVQGIGKKTAERMMIELKSRLDVAVLDDSVGGTQTAAADVRDALTTLGYAPEEVRDVMRQLDTASDSESMLRDALAVLGARRAG